MGKDCPQYKLFGYLFDGFCVGWFCFGMLHTMFIAIIVNSLSNIMVDIVSQYLLSRVTLRPLITSNISYYHIKKWLYWLVSCMILR